MAVLFPPDCRRVLVTGAAGFVGSHLVEAFRSEVDADVTVIRAGRLGNGTDLLLDLGDPASIHAGIERARPDAVFHLAGEASVAAARGAAAETWRINVAGSRELTTALARVNPHATLLFASSAEVYGRALNDGIASELTRPAPTSVYAQSKLAAEWMLASVVPPTMTLIVARPSNHIGPGQNIRFALPSFAAQLVKGERSGDAPHLLVGNLDTQRDFMDVRDVVNAYILMVARLHGRGGHETFNVGSGTVRPVRFLLDVLRGFSRVDSTVEIDPARFRPSSSSLAEIDARRLRAATGWSPQRLLEQSIEDVLDDWRIRLPDQH